MLSGSPTDATWTQRSSPGLWTRSDKLETLSAGTRRRTMGSLREGSLDKPLPVHAATQSLASQRVLLEESKSPAWRKQLVITFSEQRECRLKEHANCRQGQFGPETALPDSSCYLLRGTYCRPRSLL